MRRAAIGIGLLALACDGGRSLTWQYQLDASVRDATVQIEAAVLRGGCDGTVEETQLFARGGQASMPSALEAGTWGFRVRARSADCEWIGVGCEERALPSSDASVVVHVTGMAPASACEAGDACEDGRCASETIDAGTDAGNESDASVGCDGCLDESGNCVGGDATDACGRSGERCQDCTPCSSDVCTDGRCVPRTPATDVAVGRGVSFAIVGGRRYYWGSGMLGELGTGSFVASSAYPRADPSGTDWSTIDSGTQSTCGLRGGALYCWGSNYTSQLGIPGSGADENVPGVHMIAPGPFASVHMGATHACALTGDGTLSCWGNNAHSSVQGGAGDPVETPLELDSPPAPIAIVDAGVLHTCAIHAGALSCWGWNRAGEVGDGTSGNSRMSPSAVQGGITDWAGVSTGAGHTCGFTEDGTTYCWGCGAPCSDCGPSGELDCTGALGTGVVGSSPSPAEVPGLRSEQISVWMQSCAIDPDGALYCWGPNAEGELGVGDTSPRLSPAPVEPGSRWIDVAAGPGHTCAIREGGSVWCWGRGDESQLGNGTTASSSVPVRACID